MKILIALLILSTPAYAGISVDQRGHIELSDVTISGLDCIITAGPDHVVITNCNIGERK